MCTTCEYNMYVAGQQLYLAGNTNFSPILEILLANGWLGAAGQKTGPLLCVGETLRRGRGGLQNHQQYTRAHKVTAHTVHGCKISNIHGMASCHTADRSITRMRASLVCPCPAIAPIPSQGWPSTHVAERAISRSWTQVGIRDLVRGCLSGNRG